MAEQFKYVPGVSEIFVFNKTHCLNKTLKKNAPAFRDLVWQKFSSSFSFSVVSTFAVVCQLVSCSFLPNFWASYGSRYLFFEKMKGKCGRSSAVVRNY